MNTQPQRPIINAGDHTLGGGTMFALAGPCVLESLDLAVAIADEVKDICSSLEIPLVFKASFDKANRTSAGAGRGPGFERGLEWLNEVRERVGVEPPHGAHGEVDREEIGRQHVGDALGQQQPVTEGGESDHHHCK